MAGAPEESRTWRWLPVDLAIAIHLPTLRFGFAYDDPGLIGPLEGGARDFTPSSCGRARGSTMPSGGAGPWGTTSPTWPFTGS